MSQFREPSPERIAAATDALNAARGRIGVAFVDSTRTPGLRLEYGVYGRRDGQLLAEHEGHRIGSTQYGLSGRAQPVRFWTNESGFSEIGIFAEQEYAVFESGTDDQLSESMTRQQARQWLADAYDAGETRSLVIRLAGSR
jgi:hypothetical protein